MAKRRAGRRIRIWSAGKSVKSAKGYQQAERGINRTGGALRGLLGPAAGFSLTAATVTTGMLDIARSSGTAANKLAGLRARFTNLTRPVQEATDSFQDFFRGLPGWVQGVIALSGGIAGLGTAIGVHRLARRIPGVNRLPGLRPPSRGVGTGGFDGARPPRNYQPPPALGGENYPRPNALYRFGRTPLGRFGGVVGRGLQRGLTRLGPGGAVAGSLLGVGLGAFGATAGSLQYAKENPAPVAFRGFLGAAVRAA